LSNVLFVLHQTKNKKREEKENAGRNGGRLYASAAAVGDKQKPGRRGRVGALVQLLPEEKAAVLTRDADLSAMS
jgi:hypothetical protein